MKILVDADACPVVDIIIKVASEFKIQLLLFMDTSHVPHNGYGETIIVGKGNDAVDYELINKTQAGDIIITQDYGVAAMGLAKCAHVLNQNGLIYSDNNIDRLLFERHVAKKIRRAGGKTSNPSKRTKENDIKFENTLRNICIKAIDSK